MGVPILEEGDRESGTMTDLLLVTFDFRILSINVCGKVVDVNGLAVDHRTPDRKLAIQRRALQRQ